MDLFEKGFMKKNVFDVCVCMHVLFDVCVGVLLWTCLRKGLWGKNCLMFVCTCMFCFMFV